MKKLFYYTDVLPLLSRERQAIQKLERNLEIFHEACDSIRLVWHPWSKTDEYLRINHSGVRGEYSRIVEKYLGEGWGDLDTTDTYQDAKAVLMECDAYYGDVSDLAYEAQLAKLPVMLQNFDI